MGRYFGTDGIRGIYGQDMTEELCFKAGFGVANVFKGDCIIARDTRPDGQALTSAFIRGLVSAGAGVRDAGVLPTPAVSFLVKYFNASCGVVISASHNPPQYNGIKVFGAGGVKIGVADEQRIEDYIQKGGAWGFSTGTVTELGEGRELYVQSLIKGRRNLSGFKLLLDSGHGATGTIAAEVFSFLGARVLPINDSGQGRLINKECGALFIDAIKKQYAGLGYDFMFGFDGDGDRMAAVYKDRVLDGDSVLYSLSASRTLKDGAVVGTVMSNSALEERLILDGKRLLRTQVGDKNILELMLKNGFNLGGEQSGHYIFYPESVSGDGIRAAISLTLSALDGAVTHLDLTPQKTVSVCAPFNALDDIGVKRAISVQCKRLKRLLVRASGTEPKIRIMAEGSDEGLVDEAISQIEQAIRECAP